MNSVQYAAGTAGVVLRKESGRVKPLSAVCGLCSEDTDKDTAADTKAAEAMCGAMFQMISKSSDFTGFQSLLGGLISAVNPWVEC